MFNRLLLLLETARLLIESRKKVKESVPTVPFEIKSLAFSILNAASMESSSNLQDAINSAKNISKMLEKRGIKNAYSRIVNIVKSHVPTRELIDISDKLREKYRTEPQRVRPGRIRTASIKARGVFAGMKHPAIYPALGGDIWPEEEKERAERMGTVFSKKPTEEKPTLEKEGKRRKKVKETVEPSESLYLKIKREEMAILDKEGMLPGTKNSPDALVYDKMSKTLTPYRRLPVEPPAEPLVEPYEKYRKPEGESAIFTAIDSMIRDVRDIDKPVISRHPDMTRPPEVRISDVLIQMVRSNFTLERMSPYIYKQMPGTLRLKDVSPDGYLSIINKMSGRDRSRHKSLEFNSSDFELNAEKYAKGLRSDTHKKFIYETVTQANAMIKKSILNLQKAFESNVAGEHKIMPLDTNREEILSSLHSFSNLVSRTIPKMIEEKAESLGLRKKYEAIRPGVEPTDIISKMVTPSPEEEKAKEDIARIKQLKKMHPRWHFELEQPQSGPREPQW